MEFIRPWISQRLKTRHSDHHQKRILIEAQLPTHGDQESGDQESGDQESGDQDHPQESGDQESGDQESGDQESGDQECGDLRCKVCTVYEVYVGQRRFFRSL